eukprot:TRINITY_DN2014_c0_g1_i2.p2 TRINITY_DN2014_c0_g1~~TRINITY_DN2014_c0_g1_i2.p2  ORF type:complete len:192 (+),score=30.81 TRINITY_DN2014_c0_g1_i2:169-744(+)
MEPPRRIYVGKLAPSVTSQELEDMFSKYGKVISVDVKPRGFAFIEMDHEKDAEDAIRELDGRDLAGDRIQVEFSRSRGPPGGRDGGGRSGCFTCGSPDHWARDCPRGGNDVCFNCGEPGHFARECRGPPRGRGGPPRGRGGRYNDYGPPRGGYRYDPYGGGRGRDRYVCAASTCVPSLSLSLSFSLSPALF